MARLASFDLPRYPQRVIQRRNDRESIFRQDSDDAFYLKKLADASRKYDCSLHAYVLMTNHTHLFITPNIQARSAR